MIDDASDDELDGSPNGLHVSEDRLDLLYQFDETGESQSERAKEWNDSIQESIVIHRNYSTSACTESSTVLNNSDSIGISAEGFSKSTSVTSVNLIQRYIRQEPEIVKRDPLSIIDSNVSEYWVAETPEQISNRLADQEKDKQ